MAIKDLLIYLDNDDSCDCRIANGINVSRHYGAHITGLYVMPMMQVHAYPYAYLPSSVFESFDARAKESCESAQELFNAKTAADDVSGEVKVVSHGATDQLNRYSRYSDLLIVPANSKPESKINLSYFLTDVLFGAACPVLMMPEKDSLISLPLERIVVAWDGSREASRALGAAMMAFPDVSVFDIVTVSGNEKDAEAIVTYLVRHNKVANVHLSNSASSHVGEEILRQTSLLGGQLLVMGAYGHSRLREQILGGVTKHVLENAEIPIFFSH